MSKSGVVRRALEVLLARRNLDVDEQAIKAGRVLVDGRVVSNPAARVRSDASVRVQREARLRGDVKLSYALDRFRVPVADRVAADVGASAGGFTTALLDRGARRVYAIDVGVGQLVGRLRVDDRVVNLEGHNLGSIDRRARTRARRPRHDRSELPGRRGRVATDRGSRHRRRCRPGGTGEADVRASASPSTGAGLTSCRQRCLHGDAKRWPRARGVSSTHASQGVTGARGTTEFSVHATWTPSRTAQTRARISRGNPATDGRVS